MIISRYQLQMEVMFKQKEEKEIEKYNRWKLAHAVGLCHMIVEEDQKLNMATSMDLCYLGLLYQKR